MVSKSLLILVMTLGVAPIAMAQENPAPAAQSTLQGAGNPNASQSPLKPGNRNCLQSTGSLIPAKQGTCLPVAGRSYSRQDILNTGQVDTGRALEQLDPSITVRGGH
ncbi:MULTISPECIES: hypothetical protein [Dyella]|uniref:hypothetical protein n=1 Tax=Dyella TaxID=231454 RepID=UPI000C831E6D|nr:MULTISPECIES: hypothetical protein [Dyella]MDR3444817.1 hypothetical protein [Dyella sp.]PMQ06118.1 hypothetical protein DyAD56_07645 [Dyella sp. AD56]ULU25106.1 hypothetical protein DYST_02029 [Dyella terrae]